MKLKAFVKLRLKSVVREFPVMIFIFAVFPIVMSGLYGYFQKEMFNPKNEIEKIDVYVQDNDKSNLSKNFMLFLKSHRLKDFIDIKKDKKNITQEIIISKGYEQSLIKDNKITIKINQKKKDKEMYSHIVKDLVQNYNKEVKNGLLIENKINKMSISKEQKNILIKEIRKNLIEIYKKNAVQNSIVKTTRNLTSYEYYSVSILSFMVLITVMSLCQGYYDEKKKGIFQRILSTTISKVQYFNYSLVSYYVFAVLFNLIYIFSYKLLGLSFSGNIGLLLLIVLCKSLLEVSMASLVIAFFKDERIAKVALNTLFIVCITLGGVFFPLDKFIDNFNIVIKNITNLLPNVLIIKTYKSFLIYNSFEAIKYYLITFIVISMSLYSISLIKVSLKWGD